MSHDKVIRNYAQVNGIRMYYEIHGSGEPLVLIHGGGSDIYISFSRILPILASNFMVIAVDLRAHGRSSDKPGALTFDTDAYDVVALLRSINITKAHILGFSNGASTALRIAKRYPEVVDKVVAISAASKRDGLIPGFFEFMEHASLDNMPQSLQQAYLAIENNDLAGLQNMHDRDAHRMQQFTDWDDADISGIQSPTLLIVGDKDVITVDHTVAMWKLLPGSQLLVIPGIHGECIGEIGAYKEGSNLYKRTAEAITEFLATTRREGDATIVN